MVVAEQGLDHLGETIRLTVTSVLQTRAGGLSSAGVYPLLGIPKDANNAPDPGPPGGRPERL